MSENFGQKRRVGCSRLTFQTRNGASVNLFRQFQKGSSSVNGVFRHTLFFWLLLLSIVGVQSGCYGVRQAIRDVEDRRPRTETKAQTTLVRYITRTLGQEKTANVRLRAIRALSRISNNTTINTLRLVLQQESDLELKRAAILGLASLSASQALQELREALKSSNPEVRMAAAAALGRLGIKDARRDLLRSLSDKEPRVRAAAVRALVALDTKTALPRLMTALVDPSPKVQTAATTSLVELGDKALPTLRKELAGDNAPRRNAVLNVLPGFGKKAYPLLLWAFVEKPTRSPAQAALETLSGDKLAWKELRRLMEEKDDDKTHKAVFATLQKSGKLYVLLGVLGVWEMFSPRKRLWAVEPMGQLALALGKKGQETLLKTIRTSNDVSLQCFALISLGYTGKSALSLLIPYLKRSRRPLMKAAIRGLSKLGMDGWSELSRYVNHVDEDIRVTAILAAGSVRNSDVSSALQLQLKHPAAKVRIAVARALGVQEDRGAIPGLRKLLTDPVSDVVLSAIQALIRLGDEQNVNLYVAALKHGPYPPEPNYVRTLGKLGNAQTIPLLKGLVRRYMRSHRSYLRKAKRLWRKRWRRRKPTETKAKVMEEVKLTLATDSARHPSAICSFLEALQALNRLGDSALTVLKKQRYRHKKLFNPLLNPPMSCPWPPNLKPPQ